ncbi:Calcium-binding EF-hand family protein [Prunus dulcis]|uniref:Calcium-binding EF-hand family protein n=1 Tax=Prunus dulcis TaxID=3755 RepID=A0A4Y1RBW8_PRUDU|nr:Calcium-binding EF-hand family protein [Prunus dulcis]
MAMNGYGWFNPSFFNNLDRNGDGGLDFVEVLTFYTSLRPGTCGAMVVGAANTYDLCFRCYSSRRFRHNHTCFLDNHMLLRSKRTQLRQAGLPNLNLVITPARQIFYPPATPARNRLRQTFQALEAAITVANLITLCTIM